MHSTPITQEPPPYRYTNNKSSLGIN